ncbi:helix-turn-helix domain-containing protein [Catenuloplanes atrovinosus]|uniref:Transcriptional regulator with XRE-family HTH domain n=1 Tax=Catenuloplanes atrovinosus TaxID=137266 RepID=A0AAE3YPK2_9ACTN|nr:helix-turn-helix transcriptional regulator [Catenuloplanes atrovinosus]MDR7276063.1 transcriptional regulator with XRE-family HTH domain [Catenuloplanes atrovinosus]
MTRQGGTPPNRHEPVGVVLARLRRARGLSGAELAAAVGMSQPKISRIERGRGSPDPRDIEAIARALGADDVVVKELVQRTANAHNRIVEWRSAPDSIVDRQEVVADWEAAVDDVREFEITLIPGLLQTSGYAKAVLILFESLVRSRRTPVDERAILAAVALRIKRQEALADPAKRLHAVIAEIALRRHVCSAVEMLAQIDHLRDMAALPNVTVQIIPDEAEINMLLNHGFVLFGEDLLFIELYNTGLVSRGEQDIKYYRRVFDLAVAYATDDIDPILDRHRRRCIDKIQQDLG